MIDRTGAVPDFSFRKVLASILAAALIFQSASPAFAAEFTVFSHTYSGSEQNPPFPGWGQAPFNFPGIPPVVTSDFGVLSTSGTWELNVVNGNPQNPSVPKVDGALALLNGKPVLGPWAFNPDVAKIQQDLQKDARQVAQDQQAVTAATAALQEAVRRYGADSRQAKEAQAQLAAAQAQLSKDQADQQRDEAALTQAEAEQSGNFNVPITPDMKLSDVLKAQVVGKKGSQLTLSVKGQDNQPPVLTWTAPTANQVFQSGRVAASLHLTDDVSGIDTTTVTVLLDTASVRGLFTVISAPTLNATIMATLSVGPGRHTLTANAKDKAGNAATPATVSFVYDTAPTANAGTAQTVTAGQTVTLNGSASTDPAGLALTYQWTLTQKPTGSQAALSNATSASPTFTADVAGTYTAQLVVSDGYLSSSPSTVTVTANSGVVTLPPDPSTVAPVLNRTVATPLGSYISFLYTGTNPIQTGVSTGTITAVRAAVIRGQVLNRAGTALPGVTISILNHPEFGQTLSRADGMFDMVVNGGGPLTVAYSESGYIVAQRQVSPAWQQFTVAPTVVMIPLDTNVTTVQSNSSNVQVARGGLVGDSAGVRQQTLFFMPGTTATMVMPDGTDVALSTISVRATEATIGQTGPEAMPGQLPPTSAYTYAVDLTADEALAAGATSVQFNQPVITYVDNFLGFPVGAIMPSGYYDYGQGVWVPSNNGSIVAVLSTSGGAAQLDVDGSGTPATSDELQTLGITSAELQQVASLYAAGQSFWRVPVSHFTFYDFNQYLTEAGGGSASPSNTPPTSNPNINNCKLCPGSILQAQNQILGEQVAVVGTPYSLNYTSDKTPGYLAANQLTIPLVGATVPPNLAQVGLTVTTAGEVYTSTFAPTANLTTTYSWDGKNAYGQQMQGAQVANVVVSYSYLVVYSIPYYLAVYTINDLSYFNSASLFADPINVVSPADFSAQVGVSINAFTPVYLDVHVIKNQTFNQTLGSTMDSRAQGLGGWDLNVHQTYDPTSQTLFQGSGGRVSPDQIFNNTVMSSFAGNVALGGGYSGDGGPATQAQLSGPVASAAGPDGSLYIADEYNSVVRRVDPQGNITTFAGNGSYGESGDGGPAVDAMIEQPKGIAVGPDGTVYFSDSYGRVRSVGTNGIINTVAGSTPCEYPYNHCYGGDGGPAVQAQLDPAGLAVGPDGTIYVADQLNFRVRRIGTDGNITTYAGTGASGYQGDGGQAAAALLSNPTAVAVGADGGLYIADTYNNVIRRVGTDGTITTFAGNNSLGPGYGGDGGPATQAQLYRPMGVAVDQDGTLFIADTGNSVVRRVTLDGVINTVAGNQNGITGGDGGPATQQTITASGVSAGQFGSIYVADINADVIRLMSPPLQASATATLNVPAPDGSAVYVFDANSRHVQTLNPLTAAVEYAFSYDAAGNLVTVTDGNGNATAIARDANENPLSITGPYGQTTTLTLDATGYLSAVTDPDSETTAMTYSGSGLMQSFTDPKGNLHQMTYDSLGRLTQDLDPAGGYTAFSRTDQGSVNGADNYLVTQQSAMGRTTTYNIQNQTTNAQTETDTAPDGTQTIKITGTDGSVTTTAADGTVTTELMGPDPRWGMQAPLASNTTVTTPSGLTMNTTFARQIVLGDPTNPLSLGSQMDTLSVNGRTYTSTFSSATATFNNVTPAGRPSSSVINSLGQVVQQQTASLNPVNFSYDANGRINSVVQGTGSNARTSSLAYGSNGLLSTTTDPIGRQTSYVYDTDGRVTSMLLPGGRAIQYTYDANSNVTSIIPPSQPAHGFSFSPVNQLTQYLPPTVAGVATPQTTYAYNLDHQPTLITRPDGQTISFAYDSAGRLSTTTILSGAITHGYDPTSGYLTTLSAPSGEVVNYSYDGSLLTQIAWAGTVSGSVGRGYDQDFALITESVAGAAAISFSYDQDKLLNQAGDESLARDPNNGFLTGSSLGIVTDVLTYNGFGEPASYTASTGGSTLFSDQFNIRDNLGRITEKIEAIGGVSHTLDYTYSTAGQLTGVAMDGTAIAAYTYDGNGNRLTAQGPAVGSKTCAYDTQDRLTSCSNGESYTYTANGELLTKTLSGQTTGYQYDVLGNLLGATLPNGTQLGYIVDGKNRRIGKTVNGALTQGFLYDGKLQIVAQLDGNNNVVSQFIYGSKINVPDYMVQSGVEFRIISDNLGSPRLVVNSATAQVVQEMDYDEFGNVTNDTNPGFQPFGFGGGLYDQDLKFVRFGARDYDPTNGRWTAKDPIRFKGGDSNLYGYVFENPINEIDPQGKDVLLVQTPGIWGHQVVYIGNEQTGYQSFQYYPNDSGTSGTLLDLLGTNPGVVDVSAPGIMFIYGDIVDQALQTTQEDQISLGFANGYSSEWRGTNYSLVFSNCHQFAQGLFNGATSVNGSGDWEYTPDSDGADEDDF